MCRAMTASTSMASATPTWWRCTRRPGSPACRSSSSAAGATTATGPYFLTHAKQDQAPEEVLGAFLAPALRRPAAAAAGAAQPRPAGRRADRRGAVAQGRPQGRAAPPAARRQARRGRARRDQCARGAGTPHGGGHGAERSCCDGVARRSSTCRRRRSASRSTTTATSMGANAYGVMIVAGPDGLPEAGLPQIRDQGPRHGRATTSP